MPESRLGAALADAPSRAKRPKAGPPEPSRLIDVEVQDGSEINPEWRKPVAAAWRKSTEPKFASGNVVQRPEPLHADGASATHSAEDRSGAAIFSFLFTTVWSVRLRSRIETVLPLTVTAAETVSPGLTASLSVTGGAGRISYHAEYTGVPDAVQSAPVPICSSEVEPCVSPPSPTQKAE